MKSTDAAALANVRLIDHPLVQHKLTLMRRRDTPFAQFRRLLSEIASLMIYEVCRDMPLQDVEIETPLERMRAPVIDGKQLVFASILRAGEGLLEGALGVVPSARVCHISAISPATLLKNGFILASPPAAGWPAPALPYQPVAGSASWSARRSPPRNQCP